MLGDSDEEQDYQLLEDNQSIPNNQMEIEFNPNQQIQDYNIDQGYDFVNRIQTDKFSICEKFLITLEIVYSNIPPSDIEDDEDLIRFQTYLGAIDGQIQNTILLQGQDNVRVSDIQQEYFNYINNTNKFRINSNDPNDVYQYFNDYMFTIRHLKFQIIKTNNNQQLFFFNDQLQQIIVNENQDLNDLNTLNQNSNEMLQIISNWISPQLPSEQEVNYPTFIRSCYVTGIKEFSQSQLKYQIQPGLLIEQQPYYIQNKTKYIYDQFLNGIRAFGFKNRKMILEQIIDKIDLNQQISKHQHCLLRVLYYFERLKNQSLKFEDFIIQFINNQFNFEEENFQNIKLISKDKKKIQDQNILFGSVLDLVKIIKNKYQINLGIYLLNSSCYKFPKQHYVIIIFDGHVTLSDNIQIKELLRFQQHKHPYQILNKNNKRLINKLQKRQIIIEQQQQKFVNYYLDIETYMVDDSEVNYKDRYKGMNLPYLICIISENGDKIFFKDDTCIQDFIQWIKQIETLEQISIIWSFNGGKFDYLLLINDLILNFQCQIIGSETDLKQIEINKQIYFKDIKQIFIYGSLNQQAKNWGIEQQKQEFDIKGWTLQKYRDPLMFDKVLEYCFQDCVVLQKIVEKFYQLIDDEFTNNQNNTNKIKFDILNVYSASQLSLQIYLQFYNKFDLKSSWTREIYDIEKSSYYGGMTINFQKQGNNLYLYDINSSYPNVMKNYKIPYEPITNNITQIQPIPIDFNLSDIQDQYLYEVEVQFNNQVIIPTLPYRTKDGLIYMLKVERSWRWGIEINFIRKYYLSQDIKIFNVIKYKSEFIFSEFITDLYNKRLNEKRDDKKQFYKLIMNSLYGKFGQREFGVNKYVSNEQMEEYLKDPLIESITNINANIKKISIPKKDNLQFTGSLVRIASYITALSRIELLKGIYNVGVQNVYYCDTDSIVTTVKMDDQFIGNQLGQWKQEYIINYGIFLAPKIYILDIQLSEEEINKNKSVRGSQLNKKIFGSLQKDGYIKIINPDVFTRKFGKIYINKQEKIIKILDLKRKWCLNGKSKPYIDLIEFEQQVTQKKLKYDIIMQTKKLTKRFNDILQNDDPSNYLRKQRLNEKYGNNINLYISQHIKYL